MVVLDELNESEQRKKQKEMKLKHQQYQQRLIYAFRFDGGCGYRFCSVWQQPWCDQPTGFGSSDWYHWYHADWQHHFKFWCHADRAVNSCQKRGS